MSNYEKIKQLLDDLKVSHEILDSKQCSLDLDEQIKSLGLSYRECVSTILIKNSKGQKFGLLRRDDRKLDRKKLEEYIGKGGFSMCNGDELEEIGFEVGLLSPILLSNKFDIGIKVLVDKNVMEADRICVGMCSARYTLKLDKIELFEILGSYELADFTATNPLRVDGVGKADVKKRMVTGDRPTFHTFPIAAYIGTLQNRLHYQYEYEAFVFIADYHALTTHYDKIESIYKNSLGLLKTYLSIGLDPRVVTFYRQSRIPQIFRLHVILSMITTLPELERQPMLKEKIAAGYKLTHGLMGYPVLMASDILILKSNVVPVAKDNQAHIEITRDLAERFNKLYGKVFPIPDGAIGDVIVGLDGKGKSGKSTGGIFFTDTTEEVRKKVMGMYTDPNRKSATDRGCVEGNPVFIYHERFNDNKEEVEDLKTRYRCGKVTDVEVKTSLFNAVERFLAPIREKRAEIDKKGDKCLIDILEGGEEKVRRIADSTVSEVMRVMKY